MGNTQQAYDSEKNNIIKNRKKECEKFNACDKDKLYRELTNSSPRRKSKRSRKSKSKSKRSRKSKRNS